MAKLHNQKLKYFMPIMESYMVGGEFFIKGVAINETTTRNGHTFMSEELQKSCHTIRDKPLLKDHINSVDFIVGRTTQNCDYNNQSRCVDFEAKVMDKEMQQKIDDGRVRDVSVGCMVDEIVEGEDGNVILKGIEFLELSLVAIPADPNAGLAKAIMSVFHNDDNMEEDNEDDNFLNKEEESKVGELETMKEEALKLEQEKARLEQELADYKSKEAKATEEKRISEEVEKRIATEKAKLEEEKKALLAKEDKTKGKINQGDDDDDKVDELAGLSFAREDGKWCMTVDKYDSKFKRLSREA